jgi:5-oxoprolinase (ATP-hydrolysing) subunit C
MTTPEAPNHSLARVTVLNAGIYSLLVDFGRSHSRGLGVPVGGAADRAALSIGNALVGNAPDAVALEISLVGPTLQTDTDIAAVVYGAPFHVATGQSTLVAGKTFTLEAGDELHIGGTAQGMRAYLCVHGGFQSPRILDSHSGLEPLAAGTVVTCSGGRIPSHFLREVFTDRDDPNTLRLLPGRQAEWFALDDFYGPAFTVQPESNRMGLRLEGPPQRLPDRQLLSEPVCPGTVQVTTNGQCIVLGRDGQTIGGYPKIAQVIGADVDKLAQLRPGAVIRFERVEQEAAERWYREREKELRKWVMRIRTAAAGGC